MVRIVLHYAASLHGVQRLDKEFEIDGLHWRILASENSIRAGSTEESIRTGTCRTNICLVECPYHARRRCSVYSFIPARRAFGCYSTTPCASACPPRKLKSKNSIQRWDVRISTHRTAYSLPRPLTGVPRAKTVPNGIKVYLVN